MIPDLLERVGSESPPPRGVVTVFMPIFDK
jgi:hypothetical protein